MKIIVGLGNPGPKYRNTRHNAGFMVLDSMADDLGVAFSREKYRALITEARLGYEKLLLLKPMTYMNLSGDSVAMAARNKIEDPGDILVIVDDVNLPLGRLRFRRGGSAGGHNGLKSIAERLGTQDFARLRMGVGNAEGSDNLTGHVLGKFRPEEKGALAEMVTSARDAAKYFVKNDIDSAMNEFNRTK